MSFNPFENSKNNGSGSNIDTSTYATELLLNLDSDNYVLNGLLKNENGKILGSPQIINLPLENMIIDGEYNDEEKKIILTLKNGNTINFSVADLINGLQTEITLSNPLNADLIDDSNATNKFITPSEKEKIENIINIAGTGLSKSNTTINHTNSVIAKNTHGFAQITYDTEGHITGSIPTTIAQEKAINSGITANKVEQITKNKTDIETLWNLQNIKKYGYKISKNDINPNTRVEYLYDAVGMTPVYMNYTTGEFNYGSWGDIWFIKENRPVALKYDGTVDYELNHNDYTKKIDNSASDIMNSNYNGNFMSEIPLVWVKRWEDNDYNYVVFCSVQLDEDYHAYAHMNANGDVNNVFYAPLFKGSVINNKMRSIAGQMPTGNTTTSEEKNYAESCGVDWQMWDRSKHELITDLLTLISKSTNSQEKFGEGSYNTVLPTGGYNSTAGDIQTYSFSPTGQFWGSSDTDKHVKVFHIEDFWGSRYERCLGLNMVDYKYVVKMFPPYSLEPDETYDTIDDITVGRSAGTITNVSTGYYGSLPTEITSISSSTGYCDAFSPGNNCISIFGLSMGTDAGSYALFFNYLDYSDKAFGGSVCFNNSQEI